MDSSNLISCFNCGTLNVIGAGSCRNCRAVQYYNCPYCHAGVNTTLTNCSNCGHKLNWPREVYYAENTYNPVKSTSPAVILLLMGSVLLFFIAINLIANSSNPANAVSHTTGVAGSSNLPANQTKVATQPNVYDPYPITTAPSMTQIPSSPSYPDAVLNSAQVPISYDATIIFPVTPSSPAAGSTYVPNRSSYLDTIYPKWGRCSGGSCRGYNQ